MLTIESLFRSLRSHDVRALLIGGLASIAHGVPRTSVDVDLFVEPDEENVGRVVTALKSLGLVPDTERVDEILGQGGVTFTNDLEVDVITDLWGIAFEELWKSSVEVEYESEVVNIPSLDDQIRLLRQAGRNRDLEDLKVLERKLKEIGEM